MRESMNSLTATQMDLLCAWTFLDARTVAKYYVGLGTRPKIYERLKSAADALNIPGPKVPAKGRNQ